MSKKELLPCPFCGSKARLVRIAAGCAAECTGCDVRMMLGSVGVGWYATEDEAAADWNRRQHSAPAASAVQNAGIQAALDYSRNFANSKPGIGRAEKEHILGLASLLERVAATAAPVAQAEQEPLAEVDHEMDEAIHWLVNPEQVATGTRLYTSPTAHDAALAEALEKIIKLEPETGDPESFEALAHIHAQECLADIKKIARAALAGKGGVQ